MTDPRALPRQENSVPAPDFEDAARGLAHLEQLASENRRLRDALEAALEWLPEPERTTIAEVLR